MGSSPPNARKGGAIEPRKNAWRERVQAEIAELSSQVWHLETELRDLQNPRTKLVLLKPSPARNSVVVDENKRLRDALQRQLQTARELIHAFTGISADELGINLFSAARQWSPTPSSLDSFSDRFALLLADVERAYTMVQSVLEPAGPQCTTEGWTPHFYTREADGQKEFVLEMRDCRTVQLNFERFCDTIWRAVEQAPWKGDATDHEMICQDNIVAVRVRFTKTFRGSTLHLMTHVLTKRFVDKNEQVMIWRGITTVENNEELADVFVEDTGYGRMTRMTDPHSGAESALKQGYVQTVPRRAGNKSLDDCPVLGGILTNLILATSYAAVDSIDELVENLLIDDCMSEVA